MRPTDGRRPGGRGRRTGELRASRSLDEQSTVAPDRIRVLRDPLWEIQPAETTKAYQAFRVYRDLGPSRTQAKAADILDMQVNARHAKSSPSNALAALSSKYRWVERVRAYDAYLETMLLGAQESALRDASRSWVARQSEIREREYALAMGLAEKVQEMLAYPVRRITRRTESKDGKRVYLTIIEPARWDWKSAADILARIGYQARLAADMVTDGARAPSPDMTDRGVADIDAWLNEIGVSAEGQDAAARQERERS